MSNPLDVHPEAPSYLPADVDGREGSVRVAAGGEAPVKAQHVAELIGALFKGCDVDNLSASSGVSESTATGVANARMMRG